MTQYYIGVKQVQAWEETKDGQDGYSVKYPDGYISWSPKETFEKSYLPQGNDPTKVSLAMVESLIRNVDTTDFNDHTTAVEVTLKSGFTLIETAACVDPSNYDQEIGKGVAMKRVNESLWFAMGFVLQWAKDGLTDS